MGLLRTKLFTLVAIVVATGSGCKTLRVDSSQATREESYTASSRHYVSESLPDSLFELWEYNAEAGFGPSSPLIAGSHVFVGNRRGEVHAIDIETGKRIGAKKFGEAINGTPAINRERLYIPVDFGGRKGLRTWDLVSGKRVHDLTTAPVESNVLVDDIRFVFVDTESVLRSHDTSTGEELWTLQLDPSIPVIAPPVLLTGNRLVVVNTRGHGEIVDLEDGNVIGSFSIDGSVYNALSAAGSRVYVATTEGQLFLVDVSTTNPQRRIQGSGRLQNTERDRRGGESSVATVELLFATDNESIQLTSAAIGDRVVVVAGSDGYVHALDSHTGGVNWSADAQYPIAAPPFIAGSKVYVGTLGRTLSSIDVETGEVIETHILKGRVKSPMNSAGGELFVLSEPRFVYRFGKSVPSN